MATITNDNGPPVLRQRQAVGGELVRFEHRGRFFAAGFAVVRHGAVVARMVTARSLEATPPNALSFGEVFSGALCHPAKQKSRLACRTPRGA